MAFVDSSSLNDIKNMFLVTQREDVQTWRKPRFPPEEEEEEDEKEGEGNPKDEVDEQSEMDAKLDEELRRRAREDTEKCFKLFDDDGNGLLTIAEIYRHMKPIRTDVTEEEVADIVQELDEDGRGGVTFATFEQTMREVFRKSTMKEDLRFVFEFIDCDHDGYVSSMELQLMFRSCGEMFTPDECLDIMQKLDRGKDGLMDFEEFALYCETFLEDYQRGISNNDIVEDVIDDEEEEEEEPPQGGGGFG